MKVWLIFIQVIFKNISCFIVKLGAKEKLEFIFVQAVCSQKKINILSKKVNLIAVKGKDTSSENAG